MAVVVSCGGFSSCKSTSQHTKLMFSPLDSFAIFMTYFITLRLRCHERGPGLLFLQSDSSMTSRCLHWISIAEEERILRGAAYDSTHLLSHGLSEQEYRIQRVLCSDCHRD